MPSVNELLEEILLATSEGTGAGFLMPDSATYPFASDGARDTWATSNKEDLVKNSTVVNVSSTTWYVWRGEDNPPSYDSSNWSDVTPIIKGEQGDPADLSSISFNTITKTNSDSTALVSSLVSQPDNTGVVVDGELTTTKGTLNIGRGLSLGESGLAPLFKDIIEDQSSIPLAVNVNDDGTTDSPHYIKRYGLQNSIIQPLDDETNSGPLEAVVPVTFTRVVTKLRAKFASSATGLRLTLRYAATPTQTNGIVLFQSSTDAEFNSGGGFNVTSGVYEIDLGSEAAKLINSSFVYISFEQSPEGTGQIDLLGSTFAIAGVTQFYPYLEQTYALEESVNLPLESLNWKQLSSDYTSIDGDMYLDCRPVSSNITLTIGDSYPDDWSGLFIYNESLSYNVEVRKANGDLVIVINKKEGQAIYSSGGTFQFANIKVRPPGLQDIIEYNVNADSSVSLDSSVVGKLVSITQTNQTPIPMIFTLADHGDFSTGDTIKIAIGSNYVNYFFGVIYNLGNAAQRAVYPNNSIELVRTDSGWDVSQDGSFVRTAIVTAGDAGNALVGNEASIQSVQAISVVENDAVSILDDGSGHRTLQLDLNQIEPTSLADNAPYRIYKSIAEIEVDFGPITFAPLDGVNDDQIRANNALTLIDAIGDLAMADLTIGSDLTISPIEYAQLVVNSKSDQRVSITAVSKKTSDFWLFSGELSDVGGSTTSRWEQLHRNGKALNMGGNTIKNLATGGADSDAITKLQSENYIDAQFGKANETGGDLSPYEVDLKDSTRDAGYGSTVSGEIGKITYFGVNDDEVVVPDLRYGKMFFIHLAVSGERGYWMVHESLLSGFVTSSTIKIPFSVGEVEVGLSKNNQVAPDIVHDADAIWNSTGGAIKNTDNANTLPPPNNYYDKQEVEGGAVKRNDAMSALYTAGRLEIVFDELTRGSIKNVNDLSAVFVSDPSSEWFTVKAVKKGSTFGIKKLFMLLPYEYAYTFYSTGDNAIAFGLKVGDNRERILELEKQVSELTPVAQDEDDNGLAETIMMPAHIIKEIEIDVGETKTLDIGYENNQVNLLAYEIFIKSLETDVNDINYGRNFEVKGALIKSNGSFSFVKSQATGESLNLVVSASMVDEHIQVSLSGAPCKLSINTKAVVKR